MGYYTNYKLEIIREHKEDVTDETVMKAFASEFENVTGYELTYISDFKFIIEGSVKWYNHEKDMLELSYSHPSWGFMLEGVGEERGDIWVAYFLNGNYIRRQRQEIESDRCYPWYNAPII